MDSYAVCCAVVECGEAVHAIRNLFRKLRERHGRIAWMVDSHPSAGMCSPGALGLPGEHQFRTSTGPHTEHLVRAWHFVVRSAPARDAGLIRQNVTGRARATSARMKCYEKYCPDLTQKEKAWLGFEDPAKLRDILNRVRGLPTVCFCV